MHALVLSGGGAYAAYEVGVMKALFNGLSAVTDYKPLVPAIVTGTSAGAFNGALLLSSAEKDGALAISYMEHVWLDRIADTPDTCGSGVFRFRGNLFDFFDSGCLRQNPALPFAYLVDDATYLGQDWLRRGVNFLRSSVDLEQRSLELVDLGSLISTEPYNRLVAETIQTEPIQRSKIILKIAVTNWRTGELRVFGNEDMSVEIGSQVVLASSSIPGVFPSVEIEGEPYVDGGIVMNTPLKPAVDAGADTLHVIYMDPNVQAISLPKIRNTVSTAYRMMIISFGSTMRRDIEIAERINRGTDAFNNGSAPPDEDKKSSGFIAHKVRQIEGKPAYRKLTIHRYHPREDLGGIFRWLSFGRDHLIRLIEKGLADTIAHDCAANRCVIPH